MDASTGSGKGRSAEFVGAVLVIGLLGFLGLVLWAAATSKWFWLIGGVVAIVVLAFAALASAARARKPSAPALPDGAARHVDDGIHRILVIAEAVCSKADLGSLPALGSADAKASVFVIAPVLGSKVSRWSGDQRTYHDAQAYLKGTLASLAELHVEADGLVGTDDPMQAIEDGLRQFPADEIVFALPANADANETGGLANEARRRYPLPVRELVVSDSSSQNI
jgi:hypothetical protein